MPDINSAAMQAGSSLEGLYNQAAGFANSTSLMEIGVGDAAALVAKTEGLAKLETQERNLAAATALGTNPADASYMLTTLANDINARYAERDVAIQASQRAASTNLFTDGPLAWLGAQLDIPALNQQQETSEARYDNARQHYQQLNQLTQTAAVTHNAIEQTKTISSIEAEAEALQMQAMVRANTAKIQGLQMNANGIKEAFSMKQTVFDNNMRLRNEARADEQMQFSRENARLARADREKNSKDVTSYLNAVNAYRVSLGQTAIDEQTMRLKLNSAQGKQELDNQFELGLVSLQTGKQILGNNAYESLNVISTPGIKVSGGAAEVAASMRGIIERGLGGQQLKPNEIPNAVNKLIASEAERMMKNVSSGKDNFYAPPPLATIADGELQNMPLIQRVVKPQLDAGVTAFEPEKLLQQGMALVRKGELKLEDVTVGVAALGRKAVAYNNGYRNYEGLGLPRQKFLPMTLDTTGSFGGTVQNAIDTASAQGNSFGAGVASIVAYPHRFLGLGPTRSTVDITDDVAVSAYANKILAGEIATSVRNLQNGKKKTEQ